MGRPRTPILSRASICEAALAIVDTEGLAGLSMRKLAARLGVQVASLYHHVTTKDEVLHEIGDAIMSSVDVSGFAAHDWRAGLARWARSYRAALRSHPNMLPFLTAGPGRRASALRRADAVHGALVDAGWPPRQATLIGASIKYLVVGAATTSFADGFDDDALLYQDRYPHLTGAHRLRSVAAEIDEEAFGLLLDAFLDGLDARYAGLREVAGDHPG
ncbi:TetR/AcrR family transcriptional regulator [Streptomyces specialis]|uniref:TetR/AcrR family transcriptional regulator n=1 Tax=Streptomyces specialis TaxID=498367 RepID=UPI00073E9599|nr:TetR/AcrR family transcriptional regulator C-terminal domain-containing protein [Streptomyces specialis]